MVCPHRLGPTRQVGFPSRSRCACNIYIYIYIYIYRYLSSVFHYIISYHRFSFSYIALGDPLLGSRVVRHDIMHLNISAFECAKYESARLCRVHRV
jgi:hypothetical protein